LLVTERLFEAGLDVQGIQITRALVNPGYVVAGKYELVRLLGRGSMREVWESRHRSLGEDVAVKLLTGDARWGHAENSSTAAGRFLLEAQVAAHLSAKTRHIVRVSDHGEERGLAYLVMELLEGHTLEKWLMLRGEMPLGAVSSLVSQIARGLAVAHDEGVVHRDLKPGNIFLAQDEDGRRLVKLLDFGIARAMRATRAFASAPGMLYGTPGYMSPEQLRASSRVDHRCDLWALATVAYEALTGELPLPGSHSVELLRNLTAGRIVPIHERAPHLPPSLAGFFDRAFAARIEERFQSALDLASAFKHASGMTGANSAPPSTRPTSRGGTVLMRTLVMRPVKVGRRPGWRWTPTLMALVIAGSLLVLLGARALWQVAHAARTSRTSESTSSVLVSGQTSSSAEPAMPSAIGALR